MNTNEENDWKLESGNGEGLSNVTGGWYDPDYVPREKTFWEKAKSRVERTAAYQLYQRVSDTWEYFKNWPDDYGDW